MKFLITLSVVLASFVGHDSILSQQDITLSSNTASYTFKVATIQHHDESLSQQLFYRGQYLETDLSDCAGPCQQEFTSLMLGGNGILLVSFREADRDRTVMFKYDKKNDTFVRIRK